MSNQRGSSPFLWIKENKYLLGTSFSHLMIDGFSMVIYPLLPLIAREFNLTLSKVGILRTTYSLSTSFLQLPVSVLLEPMSEIISIIIGILWVSFGFLLMSVSSTFLMLLIVSFIAGLGGNIQHPIGSSFVSRVYDKNRRGSSLGFLNFSGDIGKTIFPIIISWILTFYLWRNCLFIFGVFGTLVSILMFYIYRRSIRGIHKKDIKTDSSATSKNNGSYYGKWGITSVPKFVVLSIIGILDAASRVIMLTYLPFLFIQKGIKAEKTGVYLTILLTGGSAGKLGCGFLSDRFGYLPMILITEILTSLSILLIYFNNNLILLIVLLFIGGFVLNGTSTVLYTTVAELVSTEKRNRGYGLFYTIYLIAEALGPVAFGYIGQVWGLGSIYFVLSGFTFLIVPFAIWLKSMNGRQVTQQ